MSVCDRKTETHVKTSLTGTCHYSYLSSSSKRRVCTTWFDIQNGDQTLDLDNESTADEEQQPSFANKLVSHKDASVEQLCLNQGTCITQPCEKSPEEHSR